MRIAGLFLVLSLLACLTACEDVETKSDTSIEDVKTTSEIVSASNELTCPFVSFSSSPVRVSAPAYAPYLLELDEQAVMTLSETFENTSWELISSDTPYPDGETYSVFVYNNGQPFRLVFYGDFTVDYEHKDTIERYKYGDSSIHSMVFDVANPDNLGDIFDTLIWCEPEFFTNENVWNEHDYQHNEIEPQS